MNSNPLPDNSEPSSHHVTLPHPIAIPQTTIPSLLDPPPPFTRAYPPILAPSIPKPTFLTILDTLNTALAAPVPFQVMEDAATGLGFVPEPITQGVSVGLDVIAGVGSAASTYLRAKRYIERVNREVWAPRGLKMVVVRDEVLGRMLGGVEMVEPNSASQQEMQSIPMARLAALGDRIAPLDLELLAPGEQSTQTNYIDRLSAREQAKKTAKNDKKLAKKQDKRSRKLERRNAKVAEQEAKSGGDGVPWRCLQVPFNDDDSEDEGFDEAFRRKKELRKAEAKGRELGVGDEKIARQVEEKRRRLEETIEKYVTRGVKREEKSRKKVHSLEWLVICDVHCEIPIVPGTAQKKMRALYEDGKRLL